MDEAKEGVIYFSLGSNIPDGQLPEHIRDAFVTAFSKLKQHVLWKIKVDSIPGLSSNVKLLQWAPQQDILGNYFFMHVTGIGIYKLKNFKIYR